MTGTGQRGDLRPPEVHAEEKTTLRVFLDYLREAVAAKLAGVDDAQARLPGVSSGTSLLGLVKHLTAVELNWFVWAYAGAAEARWDDAAPRCSGEGSRAPTTSRKPGLFLQRRQRGAERCTHSRGP